jgi:hypothetical protein
MTTGIVRPPRLPAHVGWRQLVWAGSAHLPVFFRRRLDGWTARVERTLCPFPTGGEMGWELALLTPAGASVPYTLPSYPGAPYFADDDLEGAMRAGNAVLVELNRQLVEARRRYRAPLRLVKSDNKWRPRR